MIWFELIPGPKLKTWKLQSFPQLNPFFNNGLASGLFAVCHTITFFTDLKWLGGFPGQNHITSLNKAREIFARDLKTTKYLRILDPNSFSAEGVRGGYHVRWEPRVGDPAPRWDKVQSSYASRVRTNLFSGYH